MNINQLRYIVAIAETKNFSKAAKKSFVSQPALSQYVKKLEEELGVEIFLRNKSKVEITEAGEIFVEEAIKLIESYNNLLSRMEEFAGKSSKTLTLGISQFYGKYFLPKVIPELQKLCPGKEIKIVEADSKITEENLLRGDVDLAIIPLPIYSPKIKYRTVYMENFSIAVNEKNSKAETLKKLKKGEIDLSILKDEDFVLLNEGLKLRELSEKICKSYGFSPKVILEAENLDTLNSLVHYNIGVSLLPSMITKYSDVCYFDYTGEYASRETVVAYIDDKYGEIVDKIPVISKV
ncbi:LysR family transcriptional regulator [Anaerosphaera multitolerans]|uniref:LysR family transcriptional regulator n=1 Tax=Anaerosphaera multitolerans TaxID=2487351 RepID=A0A437S4D6_9FIRM|nr:LysR family transcriptional regulator [Anaerosphaera multitolerans]RVU53892.1 LysR family transcriptional regulator [Anaerosphaera multitolerans]